MSTVPPAVGPPSGSSASSCERPGSALEDGAPLYELSCTASGRHVSHQSGRAAMPSIALDSTRRAPVSAHTSPSSSARPTTTPAGDEITAAATAAAAAALAAAAAAAVAATPASARAAAVMASAAPSACADTLAAAPATAAACRAPTAGASGAMVSGGGEGAHGSGSTPEKVCSVTQLVPSRSHRRIVRAAATVK